MNSPSPATVVTDRVVERTPIVVAAHFDGETVVYDPRHGTSALLNVSAAEVWSAIDGTSSVVAIARRLAAAHGVAQEMVAADVAATIARFVALGLVVDHPPSDSIGSSGPDVKVAS